MFPAGEEALLADERADCRVRPCTYRAVGGCTLWCVHLLCPVRVWVSS